MDKEGREETVKGKKKLFDDLQFTSIVESMLTDSAQTKSSMVTASIPGRETPMNASQPGGSWQKHPNFFSTTP
jgi:hypothetical protein